MRARQLLVWPPMVAVHSSVLSSSWTTRSTPSMKRGYSSNWVHWLYAVAMGTRTSMASSIRLMTAPFG
jgi:hypothetical protein